MCGEFRICRNRFAGSKITYGQQFLNVCHLSEVEAVAVQECLAGTIKFLKVLRAAMTNNSQQLNVPLEGSVNLPTTETLTKQHVRPGCLTKSLSITRNKAVRSLNNAIGIFRVLTIIFWALLEASAGKGAFAGNVSKYLAKYVSAMTC
jgi:hypothetical protein